MNGLPTIKDIAKAAGVSHATVSNVLNHKGNVSAEKIKLVQDTARAMGYRINEAASALRSGKARLLAIILPDTQSEAHGDLYRALLRMAGERAYGVLLRVTDNVPEQERRAIQDVLSARAECVVVVTSFDEPSPRYAAIEQSGIRVQYALRAPAQADGFAGFDMARAAVDIAQRLQGDGAARVGLMTGMLGYPNERAFHDALLGALPRIPIRSVQSIASQYVKQAFDLLSGEAPDAIVTSGEGMARAVLRACAAIGQAPPRIYTLAAARTFPSGSYTSYQLNYRGLGRAIGESLLTHEPPRRVLLNADGFVQKRVYQKAPVTLNMLSIDTPYTEALRKLSPLLTRETGISLKITTLPTAEVSQAYATPEGPLGFDLMRMDIALIDRYASALFQPLQGLYGAMPSLAAEYAKSRGQLRTLPFDPSCQLLFYRRDLFENPRYQRAYLERHQVPLALPTTYAEYAQVAAFFDGFAAETGARGALVSRQTSECIAQMIAVSPDGAWPRMTEAEVEAYISVRRRIEAASLVAMDASWNETVDRFARGEAAMLITHANYAERLSHDPLLRTVGRIGYAAALGQRPLLGGGVIGITRHSPNREAAGAFFQWLYGGRVPAMMALLGGCSPCAEPYANDEVLDMYPWLPCVRTGLEQGIRRGIFPRAKHPFHQLRTEERIAFVCMSAVGGAITPAQALQAIHSVYPGG